MTAPIRVQAIGPSDLDLLMAVPPDLFDQPLRRDWSASFLDDPSNLLFLAFDGDLAVGMASATIIRHPDKAPSLFVNEVGTRDSHLRRGIARLLMGHLFAEGRARGCQGAWLGTEPDNEPALGLYRSLKGSEETFVGFSWEED